MNELNYVFFILGNRFNSFWRDSNSLGLNEFETRTSIAAMALNDINLRKDALAHRNPSFLPTTNASKNRSTHVARMR